MIDKTKAIKVLFYITAAVFIMAVIISGAMTILKMFPEYLNTFAFAFSVIVSILGIVTAYLIRKSAPAKTLT
ncbi:hypothetical protein KKG29_00880 [Patescibacteria group bacterium]|nr:hypothetical protein [Patescibacteria group bacterium]MBU3999719.1 hypothetical protein [Patescibacteria group bacterium]